MNGIEKNDEVLFFSKKKKKKEGIKTPWLIATFTFRFRWLFHKSVRKMKTNWKTKILEFGTFVKSSKNKVSQILKDNFSV